MQLLNLQWRKAFIAGCIGLVSSGVIFSAFWYGVFLSISNWELIGGSSTPSVLENTVFFIFLPISLCLGCAALAWSLGFRILRTAGIGLMTHIFMPLLAQFLALPYSIGDKYVHLPLLSSLALTILAGSWGSPISTISSRKATIAITIVLAVAYSFTSFHSFGFLVAWTLMPATYALFTAHDHTGNEKKGLHVLEKSLLEEK